MSRYSDKFYINGQDVYDTWGIAFLQGIYQELMKFPKRKDAYSLSYADENGTLRDTTDPKYESQTYTFAALIIADSRQGYFTRLNAFRNYILNAGYFTFDVVDLNIRFTLLYDNVTQSELKTRLNDGQNALKITLSFINDFPKSYPSIPQDSGSGD